MANPTPTASNELPVTRYKRRKQALWNERSSWIADYKDISDNLLPRSGRYFEGDRNKGGRRNQNILDSTGTEALDILGAGLMAGMTSPARPWFRLGIPDEDLMQFDPVKQWLFKCSKIMREIFARSNSYRSLHTLYEELGGFGTAAAFLRPDFKDVIRLYPMTAGEYAISTDERNEVDTVYREIPMTVAQVVAEFGLDNVSQSIKNQWSRNNLDQWVTVMHCVEPRLDNEREYGKRDGKNKRFKSCYFEAGGDPTKPLRESGFDDFPLLTPRWAVRGGDIYGHGPGMRALGDVIQLQHEQMRKGTAIDYQTMPPLQMPSSMRGRENDLLPGGTTYIDMAQPNQAIKTAFEVQLNLQHLLVDMEDVRGRIRKAFYSDLFLMLANDTRSGITATEVAERHEEKLLMLGPVLERLHNEMLSPMIDLTFTNMVTSGIMPTPPKELEGMDLKVEFVSTLAQAQRAVGLASVDRLLMTVGQLAQAKQDPSVWDKIDTDQVLDGYGDMLGIDPQFLVADDKVAFIRKSRMEQAQAQQAQAQAPEMAKTAATLSGIDTQGSNGLTDIMRQFSGYSSGSPA